MLSITRRATLSAFALLALAACGNANGDAGSAGGVRNAETGLPDIVMGDPDAPVTLVEYASVTCPACLGFHETVMPTIKEDYVETGKVKFIFREFPTPPQNVAIAGFALARCAGEDQYYDVLDDLFDSQPGILAAARQGAVIPALKAVAERHGISGDAAFDDCINNSQIRQDIADVILSGDEYQIMSTPTLILQGHKLDNSMQSRTPDGLSALIDLELAALGIETGDTEAESPEPAVEEAETPAEGDSDTTAEE
ncbi:MAG: DsbA family protein [Hyphomonadaceae bacterium]|nr:DsbA family protein [Hyphomonadaceae bacterium]